jgi:hypothetical protein
MSFKEYVENKKEQLNKFVKNQQKKQELAEQRRDADLDRQIENRKARAEKSERTYKKLKTLESYDKKIQRTETFNKKSSPSSFFGLTNKQGFGVSSKSEGSMFGGGSVIGGGIFDTGKSSKSSGSMLGGIGIGSASSGGGMLDGVFGSAPRKHHTHHHKEKHNIQHHKHKKVYMLVERR